MVLDDILLLTNLSDRRIIHLLFTEGELVLGVSGIYPRCLTIQDASSGTKAEGAFMDLDIQWFPPTRCFHAGVFDKRISP